MKILITGATGFIGSALTKKLKSLNQDVCALSRDPERAESKLGVPSFRWDGEREPIPLQALEGVTALVHLAGESIASGRWTQGRKREILRSRTDSTKNIARGLEKAGKRLDTFVSASAIGIYGNRGDEILTEKSESGAGFLAEVCRAWEHEAFAVPADRRVILRTGLALGRNGGALEKIVPVMKSGLGGRIGSGKQWMSWIHLDDLVSLYVQALTDPRMNGIYLGTSPHPETNADFTHALGHALKRPALVAVPELALKLALGEMAEETVLASQRCEPRATLNTGFSFQYPSLGPALKQILT